MITLTIKIAQHGTASSPTGVPGLEIKADPVFDNPTAIERQTSDLILAATRAAFEKASAQIGTRMHDLTRRAN